MRTGVRVMRLLVLAVFCHLALELAYAESEAMIEEEVGGVGGKEEGEGEKEMEIEETHPLRWSQTGVSVAWPTIMGGVLLPHTTRFFGVAPRSLARVMGPRSLPVLAGALLTAAGASWWMGNRVRVAGDLQILSHGSLEHGSAVRGEVGDLGGVGEMVSTGGGGNDGDPDPSMFGLTVKTDVELSPQQQQSMRDRLEELRQRYHELSDEQWQHRLRSYVASEEVLARIDRKALLEDMRQHFSEVLSFHDCSSSMPSGMLGEQEQYIFLARIMGLSSASTSTSSLAMDVHCSTVSVRQKTSRIKEVLALYGLSPAELSEKDARRAVIVAERVALLKRRYGDMEESDYRLRIQRVTKNTYVTEEMSRVELLQRIEQRYPLMVVYAFLGFLLHLDVSPLWKDRDKEFPALNVEMRYQSQKIRQWLNALRKSEHREPMPEKVQDLVMLLDESWDQVMASRFNIIVERFHIDMRDKEVLYALLKEKRAHYDNEDPGQNFLKVLLERHVLGWQHFPVKHMGRRFGGSVRDSSLATRRNHRVVEDLAFALDDLHRSFASLSELHAHQKDMIERITREELHLVSMKAYAQRRLSRDTLKMQMDDFIHTQGLDAESASLFYVALGIPRMTVEEVSRLFDRSPTEIEQRLVELMSSWQRQRLITSVHPGEYHELRERFFRLSSAQRVYLHQQMKETTLSEEAFYKKLRHYLKYELKDDYSKHVFLAMVLKLQQSSRRVMAHVYRQYHDEVEQNTRDRWVDLASNEKMSVRAKINSMIARFDDVYCPQGSEVTYKDFPQTLEALRAMTLKMYGQISEKSEDIAALALRWGYRGPVQRQVFEVKLRSYLNSLLQEQDQTSFDIFVLYEVAMLDLPTRVVGASIGRNDNTVRQRRLSLVRRFDAYVNRERYENAQELTSDLVIEFHLLQESERLRAIAVDYGWPLDDEDRLKADIMACVQQVVQTPRDLTIFMAKVLHISPLSYGDLSAYFGVGKNAVGKIGKQLQRRFLSCMGTLHAQQAGNM